MTKRILSMVLSLALLLSCVSGITLFTMAEELPDPYAWITIDQTTGERTGGGMTGIAAQEAGLGGTLDATAIGETGMYGIKLGANWGGFGFNTAGKLTGEEDMALVLEYYINQEAVAAGDVIRIGIGGNNTVSVQGHGLVFQQKSVLVFPLSATQKAALNSNTRCFLTSMGGIGANTYILSMKIVGAQYTHSITDPGYEYYDFSGDVAVCDYYPDITVPNTWKMGYTDEENPFRQYRVFGNSYSSATAENKPVYIKFYTNEDNLDTTIKIDTFQVYGEKSDGTYAATHSSLTGYAAPTVTVKDGVGGVLLPETCFRNSANAGSFRLNNTEVAKLTRVEVYDVETYCSGAAATDAMKAELHALMLAGLVNVTKDGYQAPTLDAAGATGTIACATCGAVLSESVEIPQLTTYAKIDFNNADGAVTTAIKTLGGLSTPVQIPGTEYYGAKLTYQNDKLTFALDTFGITAEDIANGTKLAINYEYYAAPTWGNNDRLTLTAGGCYNLAAYGGYQGNTYDSLCINQGNALERGKLAVMTYTVGNGVTYAVKNSGNIGNGTKAEENSSHDTGATANALVNGDTMTLLIWNSMEAADGDDSKPIYLKSITIHDAAELVTPGEGEDCYYIDYVGTATNPNYYPEYTTPSANGIATPTEQAEYYPEDTAQEYVRFDYMYVQMPEAILSDAETLKATPVKLVIERKADSDINHIYWQYQVGGPGPVWSGGYYVDFNEEGIYEITLLDARFFNSLNGGSSIRMRNTVYEQVKDGDSITYNEVLGDEYDGIASIKVYDLSADCAQYHDQFTEVNGNLIRVGRVEPTYETVGSTGELVCAHCGEVFEAASELPVLADYAKMDFSDGTIKLQSVQSVTPANADITPVVIPGTEDTYALAITTHNTGFKFKLGEFGGYTVEDIDNGLELAISVEYYLAEGFDASGRICFDAGIGADKYLALYSSYSGTTWDCTVVNPSTALAKQQLNVATFKVGKDVSYITGPGQFGGNNKFTEPVEVNTYDFAKALLSGNEVIVRLWGDKAPLYIKSITIYNANELAEREVAESNIDYIDTQVEFAESPVYYPQYVIKGYSDGLTCSEVLEITNDDGTTVVYGYYAVTRALIAADEASHPVMIRFTFKEDTELTSFSWSYQVARRDEANAGIEWGHLTTDITGPVVEVLLEDAVFENGLNGKGSFRLPNGTANGQVISNLLKVEVLAVVDKTALEEAVAAAEEAGQYKAPETVAVLEAALSNAAAVLDDAWATEQDVTDAIAAIDAAVAQLVDCDHLSGTETVGYVEETCLTEGYTGDKACVDCGFVAEGDEGTVIPAHETKLINVRENSCKEPGYSGDLWCEQCQKVVKEGTLGMALPHTWNDGEVTKPATPNERGEITKTCTVCGATTITRFEFEGTLGDVDDSGTIDSTDARLVLQFAVKKISGDALNMDVADVDGSGEIDSTDARLILQFAVGKIKEFPQV